MNPIPRQHSPARVPTEEFHHDAGLFVDHQLLAQLQVALLAVDPARPIERSQVQAASIDLRLGKTAHRLRAGFLPAQTPLESRLLELEQQRISLEHSAVLERGALYLIPLEEELSLPPDVSASFNPRSSTGRCDVFARVLAPGHTRFNEAPAGWRGRLWLEVAPLSFSVRVARGDRLCQARLERARARLLAAELADEHARCALVLDPDGLPARNPLEIDADGGLALHLGLAGRAPAGWRAKSSAVPVEFAREGAHAREEFWEPIDAPAGHAILEPGAFYVFASRERLRVSAHLSAEMLPVDVGLGEMRNNYAGFFDPGFGCGGARAGTPAVLEVRAHDLPFLVEDGQAFFRLQFFRNRALPQLPYGHQGAYPSYQGQDLTLARCFRPA